MGVALYRWGVMAQSNSLGYRDCQYSRISITAPPTKYS